MARRQPSRDTRVGAAPRRNPWLPAIAAACVLGVVVIAGVSGSGQGDASSPAPLNAELGAVDVSVAAAVVTAPPTVTESTIAKTTIAAPLKRGEFGDEVKQLQQRLADLNFAPGPVDGMFGPGTQQAVWAWKKLVGGMTWQDLDFSQSATVVTPETWSAMQDPTVVAPRRPLGPGTTHVEIYLPLQVLVVFTDDEPTLIAHIASGELDEQGNPKHWCEVVEYNTDHQGQALPEPVVRDECAYSKTPGGVFKFTRSYAGNRLGPLGGMYNPVYFNYGIAVHGAREVPTHPQSHGCIRINMDIAEYFPALVAKGDHVFVWGHDGKEPEYYSEEESKPSFNAKNPDSTSTTSSSTSSTVPVAVEGPAPVDTPRPTVTTVKSTATTVKPAGTTTVGTTTVGTTTVGSTVPVTLAPATTVATATTAAAITVAP